jgi:hypothetical protein
VVSASLNSEPKSHKRNIIRPYLDRGFKILTVDVGPQIWISTFPSAKA